MELPAAVSDAVEDADADAGVIVLEAAAAAPVPVMLPTLGDLQVAEETSAYSTVELEVPAAPAASSIAGQHAGDSARGGELRQVYQQDLEVERQLRRQNIKRLAGGSYVQARPDGAGGVELVPCTHKWYHNLFREMVPS